MKTKTKKMETHEVCPWCKKTHKIPLYAYAHWEDHFMVTCEDCGKKYQFYKGRTSK